MIRRGKPEDATTGCGAICYDAFRAISQAHNFPCDVPSAEIAAGLLQWMLSHPHFYCVVAQMGDRIVGSNVLDERNAIYGIGPITIDPSVQNKSVGRLLMDDVMARVAARELPGRSVRLATEADIDACNRICCAVHGHDRGGELLDAIRQGTATVVEYGGRITGYATIVGSSATQSVRAMSTCRRSSATQKRLSVRVSCYPPAMLNSSAGVFHTAYAYSGP